MIMNQELSVGSYSFALFCTKYHLDNYPDKIWALEDLGDGESYLQKTIKRLNTYKDLKDIYLLVEDDMPLELFQPFSKMGVKIVQMSLQGLYLPERMRYSNWNVNISPWDIIHLWVLQLFKAFDEESIVAAPIYRCFFNEYHVRSGFRAITNDSDFAHYAVTLIEPLIFYSKTTLDFPTQEMLQHNSLRGTTRVGLDEEGKKTEFLNSVLSEIGLNLKCGFNIMKDFSRLYAIESDDFYDNFKSFYNSNQDQIKNLCLRFDFDIIDDIEHGLTVLSGYLDNLSKYQHPTVIIKCRNCFEELVQKRVFDCLDKHSYHYFLDCSGKYVNVDNTELSKRFHVIQFVVDDVVNAHLLGIRESAETKSFFNNFNELMAISHANLRPQLGVEVHLPEDERASLKAITFWEKFRDNLLYLNRTYSPSSQSSSQPKIQFIKYFNQDNHQDFDPRLNQNIIDVFE
jgi:hypothetical protein